MLNSVMKKFFGTKQDRDIKELRPLLERINSLEGEIQKLSDEELQAQTPKFREQLKLKTYKNSFQFPSQFLILLTRQAALFSTL